jgi:hypothetical protein
MRDQFFSSIFGAAGNGEGWTIPDLSLGLPMRRAQWKINQPPSLRDNEQSWREPILFMVRDGLTHIGMDQADLEKADCSKCLIAKRGPIECGQRKTLRPVGGQSRPPGSE